MSRRDSEITSRLSMLTPGQLPLDVFNEVARLTATPVIELLIVSGDEVLLVRRPEGDMFWPTMLALPGQIITANGFSSIQQYAVALASRFGVKNEPTFRGIEVMYTLRGVEVAIVYQVSLERGIVGAGFKMVALGRIDEEIDVITEHGVLIKKYAANSR